MDSREAQFLNKHIDALNQDINKRMANIDARLEKLVEVVTTQTVISKQIDDHEYRLRRLESTVQQNHFVASGALKFVGWIVAGVISLMFFLLR